MPSRFDVVPMYDNVTFVHMFPFRNYDEWARSAMKQQYDRGREGGCDRAESMLERCKHNNMEIDFRKYGKTELSRFKDGAVRRMHYEDDGGGNSSEEENEGGEERHVFLLYHHRELKEVLEKLSNVYGVPPLPGSNGKGKEKRPEGTCDGKLLDMFHDCFSSKLMELT